MYLVPGEPKRMAECTARAGATDLQHQAPKHASRRSQGTWLGREQWEGGAKWQTARRGAVSIR